jgi:DNA-directed RNA polymerase II subunit RPB1
MSHIYKELEYNTDIKRIVGVQFSVFSPEEIIRRSVVKVTEPLAYDGSTGHPVLQGLFDPRMGVIEVNKLCVTCEQTYMFCPGHFGHIELARPVYFTHFLSTILKTLKCICFVCGRLLIHKRDPQLRTILKKTVGNNKKRFDEVLLLASKYKTCGQFVDDKQDNDDEDNAGCGAIQPKKFGKSNDYDIYAEHEKKDENGKIDKKKQPDRQYLTPDFVLRLFRRIPLEDLEILGFSPNWCLPSWLIANVIPVAPPAVRPSVRQHGNQRSEDDLTHKYIDLIKYNNKLSDRLESDKTTDTVIKSLTDIIQYHVATLIDNEPPNGISPATHRSNRQLKTFKQRLHGKNGRIRGNLMGKRVDFSARSVITADPNISIDELGVPKKVAMELTFPEKVNKYNINKLYQLVRNGPKVYPGAKSIKKKNEGRLRLLEYADYKSIKLEPGDVVNRHLLDGDVVLFNRQPSLHKMSMMAHRIIIMDYYTFRLNVSTTKPYNADELFNVRNSRLLQGLLRVPLKDKQCNLN